MLKDVWKQVVPADPTHPFRPVFALYAEDEDTVREYFIGEPLDAWVLADELISSKDDDRMSALKGIYYDDPMGGVVEEASNFVGYLFGEDYDRFKARYDIDLPNTTAAVVRR